MRSRWLVFLLALTFTVQLRADSITLNTGETITGTIKNETDTDVTIDVQVSAGITDERVIQKSDISKIEKVQPDQIAYEQLIKVQPNPRYSYSLDTYDRLLAPLTAFETSYPNSAYLPEIKKLADAFQAEKAHVANGEFKYLGKWISGQEAEKRRIQIMGLQVYSTMEQQVAAGDYIGAMQTFSTLERDYGTTRSYPAAVMLAREVLPVLQQDLARRMQAIVADQAQLRQTIAATAEPEKSAIIAQAKAEQDRGAAAVAAAIQSGAKWVPLIPRSQASIQTLQKVTSSETGRLAGINTGSMNLSITKVDAARAAIAAGDLEKADTLLQQATSLWAQNEDARYTLEGLKEQAQTMAAAKVAAAAAAATPKPTPRPTPQIVTIITTPTPEPEKPFYMTIPGALAIAAAVLVIGGVVTVIGQRKAREQLDAE